MECVSLEIHERKEYPGIYSVKINGREVSQHIHALQLNFEAGELPTMIIKATTEGIDLSSMALWAIPEPYKGWMEHQLESKKETPG